MKIAVTVFVAANGEFQRKYQKWNFVYFCYLAGLVSYEKPVTPRSRGNSYCIGCDSATNGQFPWQGTAQSMFKRFNNPGNSSSFRLSPGKVSLQVGTSHFCGGSVLSETKVASAAHCYQSSFNVRAGSVDNQNGGQYVAGAQFVGHPAYDSNRILNDFGVPGEDHLAPKKHQKIRPKKRLKNGSASHAGNRLWAP